MTSLAPLTAFPHSLDDQIQAKLAARAGVQRTLGREAQVGFAQHVLEVATGRRVAGTVVNKMILISLNAQDIVEAADHECFVFAHQHLMNDADRALVRRAFAPGSELYHRTTYALAQRRMPEALRQAQSGHEHAAAHAYAMWKQGHMSIESKPIAGLFGKVVNALQEGARWLRRTVLMEKLTSPEELFKALATGEIARAAQQERVTSGTAAAAPAGLMNDADDSVDSVVVTPRQRVTF